MADTNGKKRSILSAAQSVFARRGFHCARTSDIAREAGVSEGTLYNYFDSREEIFVSLFEEKWGEFVDQVRRRTASIDDPSDRLKAIFSAATKLFLRNRPLAHLFLMEASPDSVFLNGRVASRLADFLDLIEEIIEEGKRRGKYHPDLDAQVTRMVIYGAVHGILFSWMLAGEAPANIRRRFRFSMVRAASTVKLILKSGLSAPEPGGRAR